MNALLAHQLGSKLVSPFEQEDVQDDPDVRSKGAPKRRKEPYLIVDSIRPRQSEFFFLRAHLIKMFATW